MAASRLVLVLSGPTFSKIHFFINTMPILKIIPILDEIITTKIVLIIKILFFIYFSPFNLHKKKYYCPTRWFYSNGIIIQDCLGFAQRSLLRTYGQTGGRCHRHRTHHPIANGYRPLYFTLSHPQTKTFADKRTEG